mmetsp:Transcript_46387/g.140519  ORF Transcript_46387/g.140519 Transcript_46387/m.140519 type:complete len:134 (-) Transcript_46387:316-717(-)|eukprot:CAMPEP_0113546706 /NCGR_PEP_ID=MMETSP0015_2-20120614/11951_1 /TAXON_ID=2838 /ORGANISM="Odontella" /LENGTH=133 /DNA_ID=CAMNT_0000447183 /DNA_START=130 /DNA_END=531 /DNA_ORIENTATION=+ /assembly_acc=CAM_ASM_000160
MYPLRQAPLVAFFLVVSFAAAFQSASRPTPFLVPASNAGPAKLTTKLFLANDDEKSEVDLETPSILPETDAKAGTKNVVKNLNTGEEYGVSWTDPTLQKQNLSLSSLSWWAWVGVAYVVLVYANDFFHFMPTN